ncbi:Crp/Fnr family transcriptional regulator [Pedobacter xixiisoli]|uniref:cAMP-binding domain of CRP or a regulatory subunit of cAMP-dependent protein kinases n=1 Tax=Pedobacter xixiisoli TaxID=1476464 RepID=A0A286A0K7_9SPHI|nr:Crp/Fnr family transcriptional regulator [Pedobacter xixiisoli]SOD15425.1 cAMP-binding domain of CRP or a regulatory subunit of cAMP-dependent protein kinases [Pedobacter xixiisoli]
MAHSLHQHIKKFVNVSEADFAEILLFFEVLSVKKKEMLMNEGQHCKRHFFVLKGCLRLFFMKETGIEQTTQFAIENWWMTDNLAFLEQRPSSFAIQAIEQSEVLAISYEAQEKMLSQFPQMERYFRKVYEKAFAASQLRIKYINDYSREEMYIYFAKVQPTFLQRVPQYMLASYLGFTTEYLSEIKKKHLGK